MAAKPGSDLICFGGKMTIVASNPDEATRKTRRLVQALKEKHRDHTIVFGEVLGPFKEAA